MNCVKMLINYGARIDIKNGKGHTAYEEASIGTGVSMELKSFFGLCAGVDWRNHLLNCVIYSCSLVVEIAFRETHIHTHMHTSMLLLLCYRCLEEESNTII